MNCPGATYAGVYSPPAITGTDWVNAKDAELSSLRAERDALAARVATLEAALKPFVAEAMSKDDIMHDTMNPDYHLECTVTVAEVRRAAAALKGADRG